MDNSPILRPNPSPQIVHLSMDFFAPPIGTYHPLSGFRALIPPPLDSPGKPLQPLRAFFSETTSHSMITYAASQKLSPHFRWMGQSARLPSVYTVKDQEYFFTSAVGDTREEDRGQKTVMPLTQQLLVHGTVDLWFMVRNGAESGEEEEDGDEEEGEGSGRYHYFHMNDVILVTEFFNPWTKPSIITVAEKEKKDEKEKRMAEGEAVEPESFKDREGFELCLGRDFFQSYPHLMFDVTPTPASELRISSLHYPYHAQKLTYEGDALSIRAMGSCVARSAEEEEGGYILKTGFAAHFAPRSVYNTFHHLPDLLSRGKTSKNYDNKLLSCTLGRACVASVVLALEMAISLGRLCMAKRFRGVHIYQGTDIFGEGSRAQRALYQSKGLPYPNMDLIHRIFQLQAFIENPKTLNLGKVRFINCAGIENCLESAMRLATIGSTMQPVECVKTFAGSRLVSGTEHPLRWGIEDTTLDPGLYHISVDEGDLESQYPLPTAPGVTSYFDTQFEKGEDGIFAVPEEVAVKRSPMFLNFGSTKTYVVKGKPIAYTERQLYMAERKVVAGTLAVINALDVVLVPGSGEVENMSLEN